MIRFEYRGRMLVLDPSDVSCFAGDKIFGEARPVDGGGMEREKLVNCRIVFRSGAKLEFVAPDDEANKMANKITDAITIRNMVSLDGPKSP